MDAKACGFQDRAQVGNRRALAVGAGDMNDRRQLALGMVKPLQQQLHALQTEVDAPGMQLRKAGDQVAVRHRRDTVHADGAAGAISAGEGIVAGIATGAAGFDALTIAGDLVRIRQSRASVGRSS